MAKRRRDDTDGPAPAAAKGGAAKVNASVQKQPALPQQEPNGDEERVKRVRLDCEYFDQMLALIPAKHYLPRPEGEEDPHWATRKFGKHTKSGHVPSTTGPKALSKRERKEFKRVKLDPAKVESIGDLQRKRKADEAQADDNDDADNGKMSQDNGNKRTASASPAATNDIVFEEKQASLDELKARLVQRMENLRTKRRAEEMDIAQVTARRKAPKNKKKRSAKAPTAATPAKADGKPANDASAAASSSVVFNKIDMSRLTSSSSTSSAASSSASMSNDRKRKAPSDPKQALQQLERKKAKLEELQKTDQAKATAMEEHLDWQGVLAKARGESVKDDVRLLKKAVKRREKQKQKSATEWTERKKTTKASEATKIKRREENIKARQEQAKKGKKTKKPVAKRAGNTNKHKNASPGKPGKRARSSK